MLLECQCNKEDGVNLVSQKISTQEVLWVTKWYEIIFLLIHELWII